jgi:outer membrane lipoprotein-sorting protein
MDVISDGDQRSLVRVTEPPREAGQAFLSIGNNLLVYNPRLGRSLRLPPSGRSNAFLGSDLSFDDLAGGEYRDQYTAAITETSDQAVTLELVPKPEAPTPYGKLVFTVLARSYAPQSLTFFDQRGNAVKRLDFDDFQQVDGRTIPQRFEVLDLLKQDYRTTAVYKDAQYGIDVPESCFSEAALERGCF